MWSTCLFVPLVAYFPGAILFRLPLGDRARRAALSAEERVFWQVVLSVALTSILGLGLAWAGWYRFDRLLACIGVLGAILVGVYRDRLRLGPATPRPSWSALVPAGLIAVGLAVTLQAPPAEYFIGGKDPGTYVAEGVRIARSGTLHITDPLIESMPERFLNLFVEKMDRATYYGRRFLGFYLVDPAEGRVAGQFPHLYPLWIAVAYDIDGLAATRYVATVVSVLGLLAVYFAGCAIVGRPAALAGALLLAVNVARVWYSRYPNAEILLQLLVFGGVLAYLRARSDGDRFFAALAGVLLSLTIVTHLTGLLVLACAGGAVLLQACARRPVSATFLTSLAAGSVLAFLYYASVLAPYVEQSLDNLTRNPRIISWVLTGGAIVALAFALARRYRDIWQPWLPATLVATMWCLAAYSCFIRAPGFLLAPHDAAALRTFADYYLSPLGLAMALAGLAVVASKRFWTGLLLVALIAGFSLVFFHKMRIVPEHFWAARRFLAVILPGALLLLGAAAFPLTSCLRPARPIRRWVYVSATAAGVLAVVCIGAGYLRAAAPVMRHVEHETILPQLAALNARIGADDLVLIESREASDLRTTAVPLAYIYDRPVLVVRQSDPDQQALDAFIAWAKQRYDRILFIGGGGTMLLSPSTDAVLDYTVRFSVPEYESSWNAYPQEVRQKRYDLSLFELFPRRVPLERFDVDVGHDDLLRLREFHEREIVDDTGMTFRWSRRRSFISIPGITPERRIVTLWMQRGGRPDRLGPVAVEVALDRRHLRTVVVDNPLRPYRFEVPVDLADAIDEERRPGILRLVLRTWSPAEALGTTDARDLGVMVDRVTVE